MKIFYFLFYLFLPLFIFSQDPGDVAQNFGAYPGFNSSVMSIKQQTDGKILVGGGFTSYKGVTENRIIRLNADGSKDTSFNTGTGFNSDIKTIQQQTDGKILVGGYFTSYKGVTENRIIRLNADGSKDTSFNTGTGFNFHVFIIQQQTDGKILVGGEFTSFNGVTENGIIRLNADGSKDNSFNTGTGFNSSTWTIQQQTDGKILVGGSFISYKGVTENYIIRLNADGSKDTSFNTGTGFNSTVFTIQQQTDGKILVGGSFTSYKGVTENYIIRLNADGSKDTSFNTGTGFNFRVFTIQQQTDGKILVGGEFTSFNGVTENRIIRLNADGSKDTTFNTGTGFNGAIQTIQQQTDGKILLTGYFSSFNVMTTVSYIIRLNADGSKDTSFNIGTGFNGTVFTIQQQTDGKILVGGSFTSSQGATENQIIRFNVDGSKDATFITGTGFTDGFVYTIITQNDGKIIAGGYFTSYKGVLENCIIRLNADGSKDTTFNTGTGFNGTVFTIQQQTDGKILVGGEFSTYKGVTENRIIRLNADGSKDTTFNTGTGFFNSGVYSITVQNDGKILVGGCFISYNGSNERSIIRLNADGSKDLSFNTGTGFNNCVQAIAVQNDGKILVGGSFTAYQGVLGNNFIIRLNSDGSKDTTFNTGTGLNSGVWAITPQSNGKILVGGNFTVFNGATENRIIRLNTDGSKDTTFNTGIGFNSLNSHVYSITAQSNGKILVGGDFTTYKGDNSSAYLIGLHSEQNLSNDDFNVVRAMAIYPNPVKDLLYLQLNNFSAIQSVRIYDIQGKGKLVKEDTNEIINVSNLSNGLYLIKVITSDGEFTKKFIKE